MLHNMNQHLEPDYNAPRDARASIAAELARYYSELAGTVARDSTEFSLARLLIGAARRQDPSGREREVCGAAASVMAQGFDANRLWVPFGALRSMAATPGQKGGYLVGTDTVQPIDVLRPWSVVASSGAQMMIGLTDNISAPIVKNAVVAGWVAEGSAPTSDTEPSLGATSMTPKTAIALVKFSVQLLRQGVAVEGFLRMMLMAAVGELLDAAGLAGPGGVEPLGLVNTPGIGSQSGTSLAHAGMLAMRKAVLNAGAQESALQWVGAPAVQELLGGRERAAGGGRFLWDDGSILGRPAHATKNAPASTLIVGDFSQMSIGIFGPGIRIDIDPSQDFERAGLVARVMLLADVALSRPEAFCVAQGVS
jgi:HK97 family phage major capsid protein